MIALRTFRIVLSLPDPKTEFYTRPIVALGPDSSLIQEIISVIDATQTPHGLRVSRIEEHNDETNEWSLV